MQSVLLNGSGGICSYSVINWLEAIPWNKSVFCTVKVHWWHQPEPCQPYPPAPLRFCIPTSGQHAALGQPRDDNGHRATMMRSIRAAIDDNGSQVFRPATPSVPPSAMAAPAVAAAAVPTAGAFAERWPLDRPCGCCALHTAEAMPSAATSLQHWAEPAGPVAVRLPAGKRCSTRRRNQLVRDHLPADASLLDLGQHRFRDLTLPTASFNFASDGACRLSPLRSLDTIRNNLPAQVTSFVGRETKRWLGRFLRAVKAGRLLT